MELPGFEPTNPWTLIPWLMVYGTPALVIYLQQRKGRKASEEFRAKQEKKTDEIHAQAVNSHSTNLREDIDGIRDLVKSGFANVDQRLDGVDDRLRIVQRDLSVERQERIDGDKK